VFDDDAFEQIGDILTAVGGFFEKVEYLLPLDDHHGVMLIIE
jgi:hypothetical protein